MLIASGAREIVDLFFTHDVKAAALEKRDAFAFFFSARTKDAADFEGPFILTLEHEFRASGAREPRQARVVFADLESR